MDYSPRRPHPAFWDNFESLLMWKGKAFTLCPFLVVLNDRVQVFHSSRALLDMGFPDDTMIVQAWPGEYSTDYFQYRLSELKKHLG